MGFWLLRVWSVSLFFVLCLTLSRRSSAKSLFHSYSYYEPIMPILRTKQGQELAAGAANGATFSLIANATELSISFQAFGQAFVAELTVSTNLIASTFILKQYSSNGSQYSRTGLSNRCFYQGFVRGIQYSVAAFNLCGSISGIMSATDETYVVDNVKRGAKTKYYAFRQSDGKQYQSNCSIAAGPRRVMVDASAPNRSRPFRSLDEVPTGSSEYVRGPAGKNSKTRFIELYLVMDHALYLKHGDAVSSRGIELVNYASALLRSLNIYIVVVGIEVWNSGDKITISKDISETLASFLQYREYFINPGTHNDNAQLLVGKLSFADLVLGKAELGGMCTRRNSGGVTADNQDSVYRAATTMVHELGHNLGLEHDEPYDKPKEGTPISAGASRSCVCGDATGKCIMADRLAGILPTFWSSCSRSHLEEFAAYGTDICLKNLPRVKHEAIWCGNYIVDPGEECDCGPQQLCDSNCCDPATCRLKTGAVCATGECCDLSSCTLKTAGNPCRLAASKSGQSGDEGQCDLPEYCTGASEDCPDDVHLHDGAPCSNAGGDSYCHDGMCRTRGAQCRLLWGSTGRDAETECYAKYNMQGNSYGHCGYDVLYNIYARCKEADVLCGQVQCVDRAEKLAFWSTAHIVDTLKTASVSSGGTICHTVVMDATPGIANPGMVPDGAKCGDSRVCQANKCVVMAAIAEYEECSKSCGGHGHCNSKKHCHCDAPYAPPFCNEPGTGGSVDSGPVILERTNQPLLVGLLVSLVGSLSVLSVVIALLIYRKRIFCSIRSDFCGKWQHYLRGHGDFSSSCAAALAKIKHSPRKTTRRSCAYFSKQHSLEISPPIFESTTNEMLELTQEKTVRLLRVTALNAGLTDSSVISAPKVSTVSTSLMSPPILSLPTVSKWETKELTAAAQSAPLRGHLAPVNVHIPVKRNKTFLQHATKPASFAIDNCPIPTDSSERGSPHKIDTPVFNSCLVAATAQNVAAVHSSMPASVKKDVAAIAVTTCDGVPINANAPQQQPRNLMPVMLLHGVSSAPLLGIFSAPAASGGRAAAAIKSAEREVSIEKPAPSEPTVSVLVSITRTASNTTNVPASLSTVQVPVRVGTVSTAPVPAIKPVTGHVSNSTASVKNAAPLNRAVSSAARSNLPAPNASTAQASKPVVQGSIGAAAGTSLMPAHTTSSLATTAIALPVTAKGAMPGVAKKMLPVKDNRIASIGSAASATRTSVTPIAASVQQIIKSRDVVPKDVSQGQDESHMLSINSSKSPSITAPLKKPMVKARQAMEGEAANVMGDCANAKATAFQGATVRGGNENNSCSSMLTNGDASVSLVQQQSLIGGGAPRTPRKPLKQALSWSGGQRPLYENVRPSYGGITGQAYENVRPQYRRAARQLQANNEYDDVLLLPFADGPT